MQPARTGSRSLAAVLMPVAVLSLVLPLALPAEAADSLPSPSPSSTPWSAVSADGGAVPTPSAVRARIDDLAQQKSLKRSGVVVVDPGSDQVLYGKQVSRALIPASVTKILTAAAAVEVLGVSTRLATRTSEQANVVYLIGGGDATLPRSLASDAQPNGPASLRRLARSTATALGGTTKVDVVFDDSLFTGRPLGPGWAKRFPNAGVAAPVSALMIDQGRKSRSSRARVADPAKRAAQVFANILENRGVTVGRVSRGRAPDSAKELARVESAAVAEMVQRMLTESDNDVAEALGHLVGKELLNDGSFAGGARATSQVLSSAGIDTQDLALFDASGLSSRNRVSPVTIADVLTDVATERRWTELAQGLAVAGVTGTLANRFTTKATSPGRGVVRAKTGTLTGVAALAGIVLDADKRPLVFAIIGNNITSQARARDTMDRIASQLAKCGCSS
ncbi:MAG: D-alanyl-D-alanine carboxypeptidase/D-alanyl-D-alanine-endopeptidase [Actinomycetia bacterium]|nr:D-alanyl-D-alanine carboxypeptidase/D-alanyl-D-alanine-endopeptidase [Actinomycetes bacterium]MCH9707473.1 D-alanyl-D-alanine carboxypeptidase/D-alanyl-D-alanine-endopeptidase [Actinomycetes bacterium]MCH9796574.1 D-alanyl-D-alanine carboxypeptidase/D-alanyl-D-alanine-endopeptidase [Actinomycetes bacterium]MCH9851322.1 D-alanyl-D-alanine carboxypeptidase/D-alanyl-D-alanine-endopeptidase [Actinomycetes bacterium]